jgi:hypothetical protein
LVPVAWNQGRGVAHELFSIWRCGKLRVGGNAPGAPKACRIQVHKSLLNVVLLDQLPDHISQRVSSCYPAQTREKNGNPGDSFLTQ